MNCLVFYGTAEGHTQKIARSIAERLEGGGHAVRLQDASKSVADLDNLDAFLAAAPVHQQRHPDAVIDFLKLHAGRLNGMPSALVSVSLSAAFEGGRAEAQMYVDRLLERTAWKPTAVHLAAGALRYEKYDYFQEQIIRHIVLKDRAPERIEGDQDFTDWSELARFADEFMATSSRIKPAPEQPNAFR